MKSKIIIPAILFSIILAILVFALIGAKGKNQLQTTDSTSQNNQSAGQIILFYGDGCPHCANVEKYIADNNLESKISFAQKEVYKNQSNAKELEDKAKICGLPADSIGVPFLWDNGKCLVGDKDIIDFFKQKTNG